MRTINLNFGSIVSFKLRNSSKELLSEIVYQKFRRKKKKKIKWNFKFPILKSVLKGF